MIQKADSSYLDQILKLNSKIAKFMQSQGFHHWNEEYPNAVIFRRDIIRGSQYIYLEDNELIGIISFDQNYHENFDKIDWKDKSGNFYFTHRLAVDPDYQGQGIANKMMDFAENKIKEECGTSIRLGAYKKYKKLIDFYQNRNYEIKGEVIFNVSNNPFYGMEKLL